MKIFLDTVGCRLNQAEIEQIARQFRAAGHEIVGTAAEADLAVVNTCTVTTEAASDSRAKIRQAARQGVQKIAVTGCWATLEPDAAAALPGVKYVTANARKESLAAEILNLDPGAWNLEPLERVPLPGLHARTRAFIKVQDGCDNHCTYCITAIARGAGRSQQIPDVLTDIRSALAGGTKEIVLTGVHLGSWGQDLSNRHNAGVELRLQDLVTSILDETDVPRLRLSSLEPWDLDDSFFGLWAGEQRAGRPRPYVGRLCRHLHLPLQSGSASVLRRMARKITPEAFAELVAVARAAIPDVAITTDVIAGFPGETEAEFIETLDFVRSMEFARGHVFTYSARPGTAAARMDGQIKPEIRKERNAELRALFAETEHTYAHKFLGQTLSVLWESSSQLSDAGWQMEGLTDNYLRVGAITPQARWNEIDLVRLDAVADDGHLQGECQPS
jgi:threonylcarbamoyladenosine tRNA methylthiotransferase MtaB